MSDLLEFAEENNPIEISTPKVKKWKVLIVDDEVDMHSLTELVMDDFIFQGREITFFNAYSAAEAKKILKNEKDLAVVLLDVVMETQTSGLDLVKYIRDELNNKLIRIIIRTGQPGKAPEKNIIIDYDINDYKHKTELTKGKMDTVLITAIRAYQDLIILEKSRKGLKKIIEASNNLFVLKSMRQLVEGILLQLTSLLKLEEDSLYLETASFAVNDEMDKLKIVAGTGKYEPFANYPLEESVSDKIQEMIIESQRNKESYFIDNFFIGYFKSGKNKENILLLESSYIMEPTDKYLIELFSRNLTIAFQNNMRKSESINTRDEILYTLGEVTERHNTRGTRHVHRVGEIAFQLADLSGLSHKQAEEIKIAAAMHDVGKTLLKDQILDKQTSLTEREIEEMRYHTEGGEEILKAHHLSLLENAAIVAAQHHEKWDGTGYPNGLKGEQIALAARITSIALIYDALLHDQPYRKAWEEVEVLKYIKENSGKIFDPTLVDLFFENYTLINDINQMYPG